MIINASPLIVFSRLNELELLNKIFGEVIISEAVYKEVVESGILKDEFGASLIEEAIQKNKIKVKKLNELFQKRLEILRKNYRLLDKGEAETIALALQEKSKEVLIDERFAREVAISQGISPKGSLRVLLLAFENKIIDEKEMKNLLTRITSTDFRIGADILSEFFELFEDLKKKS